MLFAHSGSHKPCASCFRKIVSHCLSWGWGKMCSSYCGKSKNLWKLTTISHPSTGFCKLSIEFRVPKIVTLNRFCQWSCCVGAETDCCCFLFCHLPGILLQNKCLFNESVLKENSYKRCFLKFVLAKHMQNILTYFKIPLLSKINFRNYLILSLWKYCFLWNESGKLSKKKKKKTMSHSSYKLFGICHLIFDKFIFKYFGIVV